MNNISANEAMKAAQVAGMNPIDVLTPEELDSVDLDQLLSGNMGTEKGHYSNLLNDESIDYDFNKAAQNIVSWKREDETSRAEWLKQEKEALKALGITKESKEPRYEGATTATHPMFIEAVEQFHNRALIEMRPPNGRIVKTDVVGIEDEMLNQQAERVADFMNYIYVNDMPDEFNEMDKLLFRLPISGSCFKESYYCERTKKYCSVFVEPENLIVPWNATDLETTDRFIRRYYESHATFKRNIASGFYADDETISKSSIEEVGEIRRTALEMEGASANSTADVNQHQILRCYCSLEIEDGYDYPMEYMIWVEFETQKVIRVQRNWKPEDDQQARIVRITHYRYAQGLGFYGLGIYHLLNGSINASTDMLRTIIDASTEASFGGGYVTREAKIPLVKGQVTRGKGGIRPPPRTMTEVDCSPDELSKAFFMPPSKEPSATLFQSLQYVDNRAREMIGSSGVLTGDAGMASMPVGTVLALIEQSSIQFSAIYQRLHNAQTKEFRIVADIISENIPDEGYPYSTKGNDSVIMASDFDERIDVMPVSTPDAASKSHRIMQANALVELSGKFEGLIDPKWVLEQALSAMRIDVPKEAWTQPQQAEPDPMQQAELAKLQADTEAVQVSTTVKQKELAKVEAETANTIAEKANTNADTQFSLVQTAAQAVNNASIMPLAAQLGDIAGYVDESVYNLDNAGVDIGQQPIDPMQVEENTHPQFPPNPQMTNDDPMNAEMMQEPAPMSPEAGINTAENENNLQ